ncbi:MAG TPA: J domain-containing protein, partial [Pyrinomonadaceae bacterium]
AELVHEISEARLSGALRLERERAKAAVYFDGGNVAAALSNLRAFRLVEVLRRTGVVDGARLFALVGEKMSDEQAGVALLRGGLLDEAAMRRLHERQSKEVLRELLRWTEGEWNFDPRVRLAGLQKGLQVEAAELLAEAARGLPPALAAARTRGEETVVPVEGAQERAAAGFRLMPAEGFVLTRVYAPLRLSEVVAVSGLPEEETRHAVYVLALAGLLERPQRPRILPEEEVRQAAAAAARRQADEHAAPAAQESARQTGERPGAPEPEPDTRGTVEELFKLARGATHYEVLGVARSVSTEELKRVYYSHARRLHPDRFRRDADEEQRQRIDAAFAKIAQAYETLKDAALRAAYDLKLSKQR